MHETVTESFWLDPPWECEASTGSPKYAKQRIGLKPIDRDAWLSPADAACRAHKQIILADSYAEAVATMPGSKAAQKGLAEFAGRVEAIYPDEIIYADEIVNVAITLEDDLCMLDIARDQRLIAACVCAASYWRPSDKIGKPLWDIHGPVQGMNVKIGDSIQRFIERAAQLQPFVRRNWFVHRDREPFHLLAEGDIGVDVGDWFVRSERQTLCRIEDYLLFTIRVQCEALACITRFPVALNGLLMSLRAMDAGEIEHFGGQVELQRLLQRLMQWAG